MKASAALIGKHFDNIDQDPGAKKTTKKPNQNKKTKRTPQTTLPTN